MIKWLGIFIVVCCLSSCKDDKVGAEDLKEPSWELDTSSLPKTVRLNAKSEVLVQDWEEFTSFNRSFEAMYSATYREDLVLIIDDLVEHQKTLEASIYPDQFNVPHIKGRQNVLQTYILKVKGDLEYRQDPKPALLEMIIAYNSFRNQFNVLVNNTLPEGMITGGGDAAIK